MITAAKPASAKTPTDTDTRGMVDVTAVKESSVSILCRALCAKGGPVGGGESEVVSASRTLNYRFNCAASLSDRLADRSPKSCVLFAKRKRTCQAQLLY